MEIVCPAWCPGVENLVDAIPLLADQGVTAVELCTEYPRFGIHCPDYFDHRNAFEIEILMTELRTSGIRVNSVHAPFGPRCDISSPCDEIHERGVDSLIESIELANLTGARVVVLHGSDKLTDGSCRRVDRARGVIREMSTLAKETGVVIALENLPPGYLGSSPGEVLSLMESGTAGSVGICFDCGHANLSGGLRDYARELLPYAVEVHVHDNDGRSDRHAFPGEGSIDWREFADLITTYAGEPAMMLECAPPSSTMWGAAFQQFRNVLGQ